MEKRLDNLDAATTKAALIKSDKAIEEYLKKRNINRDSDVTELYLGNLDLTEIRPLTKYRNLHQLWVQSNKIKKLPFLAKIDSLCELYLQNNLIQSIANCFRNLTNLNVLFLQANQISDLETTANELTYLKFLKNLNLFDNPIALEKSYHNLIVYQVASLEIFDRNTIKKDERKKTLKIYEPMKEWIHSRYAFVRCVEKSTNGRIKRSNSVMRSSWCAERPKNGEACDLSLGRAVKEFSYFDWSKVKLRQDDYLVEQNNGAHIFNATDHAKLESASKLKDFKDLPQVITIKFA